MDLNLIEGKTYWRKSVDQRQKIIYSTGYFEFEIKIANEMLAGEKLKNMHDIVMHSNAKR